MKRATVYVLEGNHGRVIRVPLLPRSWMVVKYQNTFRGKVVSCNKAVAFYWDGWRFASVTGLKLKEIIVCARLNPNLPRPKAGTGWFDVGGGPVYAVDIPAALVDRVLDHIVFLGRRLSALKPVWSLVERRCERNRARQVSEYCSVSEFLTSRSLGD